MLVVAVGNAPENFDRLLSFVDDFVGRQKLDCFLQTGYSTFKPRHSTKEPFVSHSDLSAIFGEASSIIIHGGSGLFEMVALASKFPIICPRQVSLGEHTDPSQPAFVKFLMERDLCIEITCKETDSRLLEIIELASKRTLHFNQQKFAWSVNRRLGL